MQPTTGMCTWTRIGTGPGTGYPGAVIFKKLFSRVRYKDRYMLTRTCMYRVPVPVPVDGAVMNTIFLHYLNYAVPVPVPGTRVRIIRITSWYG